MKTYHGVQDDVEEQRDERVAPPALHFRVGMAAVHAQVDAGDIRRREETKNRRAARRGEGAIFHEFGVFAGGV